MNTIRWGIIGCGNVTEVKSGPGFQKAQGSELIAVMRRDAALAQDYARRHNVPRFYSDADALIRDPDINAVYIATPPGTHEFYALKVLAAKLPCYVEKPMARNTAEARRMTDAFATAGVPLFVAYYRRALPRFLKAKELIDSGALGKLRSISYHFADGASAKPASPLPWRLQAEHSGGGLFLDMGAHVVDLLDFWLGPLTFVQGQAENISNAYAVEDHVTLSMSAAGNISVSVDCNFSTGPADEFILSGSEAELRLSCFGNKPLRLRKPAAAEQTFDLPNPPHVAQPLIQTVVDDLCNTGNCPSTAASALRAQHLMDQALQSYYGNRADGFWNRPWPGAR